MCVHAHCRGRQQLLRNPELPRRRVNVRVNAPSVARYGATAPAFSVVMVMIRECNGAAMGGESRTSATWTCCSRLLGQLGGA